MPIIGAPSAPAGGTAFNAWLAGMFDGEGHVELTKKHAVRMVITNTFAPALYEIYLTLGYGSIKTTPTRAGWHTRYDWRVSHQTEITDLIDRIEPHLRIKRDEVRQARERLNGLAALVVAAEKRRAKFLSLLEGGLSIPRAGMKAGISKTHSYRLSKKGA